MNKDERHECRRKAIRAVIAGAIMPDGWSAGWVCFYEANRCTVQMLHAEFSMESWTVTPSDPGYSAWATIAEQQEAAKKAAKLATSSPSFGGSYFSSSSDEDD